MNTAALVTIVLSNTLTEVQQIGFLSHWDPYAVISLEAVAYSSYCNTVEWFWWDWSLFRWPNGFLQCFDTVGWVIWPVKIVSEMTYKVSSGTLSLYLLTNSRKTRKCIVFTSYIFSPSGFRWSAIVSRSSFLINHNVTPAGPSNNQLNMLWPTVADTR